MITIIVIVTTIIVFLMYVIAEVLGMAIFSMRIPFLMILFILIPTIIIKLYIETRKYGKKKVFRFLAESKGDEQLNLVEYILKKTNGIYYIIRNNEILIFIASSGIYLIKVIDYYGQVFGKEENSYLTLKNETTKFIPNFFFELKELEERLKKELFNDEIKKVIVSKETCQINVTYKGKFHMVGIHNLYCETQIWSKKKVYSEEQINKIKDMITTDILKIEST